MKGKEMKTCKSVFVILLMLSLCFGGCATVIKGTHEQIGISSSPTGAAFTIDGVAYLTPAIVDLPRKKSQVIHFEKKGYEPASGTVSSDTGAWWLLNTPFCLAYGVGVLGSIFDFTYGAAYELTPNNVHVNLLPVLTEKVRSGSDL